MVLELDLAERHLTRLQHRFPDVNFILAKNIDDFNAHLADADAVVSWRVTASQLANAPNLKWIQVIGAGVDGVLIPEFAKRGITVTNNSGVHAPNIAEHLMALMLSFARGLPKLIRAQERHEWYDEAGRRGTFELMDQSLLVVGLGDIGLALAERAQAFGIDVTGVRRSAGGSGPLTIPVVDFTQLSRVLPDADHVAICLPLTQETRGMFDRGRLESMRRGAYIYNIGRGAIIDQDALIDLLKSGHLGGAGLDVTDPEPLPADSPLWDFENVIITSHTSGATPKYWDRAIKILETNIERFKSGEPLVNIVDLNRGY
jgi:phosphoglycerate dehydrogenase-like enzyme